ncbi:hypothetical protein [Nostoc sp. NMS4]|uniref:hypothetical protein n=1 Tax=Nostoc sp. NMS4 TaxID=2815390 RepID=UPI0025D34B9E|nr:hypothetical protein [Nostoc sp. NMS4]MBN3928021.1 hypothetical protein [Nostoc sp. NMS4]
MITTFPIGWNGTSVTFLSIPLSVYSFDKETALNGFLLELFEWSWIPFVFAIFISLLKPLEESFSVSQILWLRLTPCQPYEVALSRVFLVIGYGIWLGGLSSLWVIIIAFFHKIYPTTLFIEIFGLISYVILCGGTIVAFDFKPSFSYSERPLVPVIALLLPLILYAIYSGLNQVIKGNYLISFFPFAVPISINSIQNISHFGMAALIGTSMLAFHVFLKFQYSMNNDFGNNNQG